MDSSSSSSLQQDVQALTALRGRLKDYLEAVALNTEAVTGWLSAHEDKIVLFHQRLNRALNKGSAAQAAALIPQMGDTAGVVLSLQDFQAKSETVFGKNNAFQKAAAGVVAGPPAALQKPLPEISAADLDVVARLDPDDPPVRNAQDEKWLSSLSARFNAGKRRQLEQQRDMRRQLHDIKSDILGLQDDRHYYVDSLMEWVADTLTSETSEGGDGAGMRRYRDPALCPRPAPPRSSGGYRGQGAGHISETARRYSLLADAMDRQDVRDIVRLMTIAYPAVATRDSAMFQRVLRADYQSATLREIVQKHIYPRYRQEDLLDQLYSRFPSAFPELRGKSAFERAIIRLEKKIKPYIFGRS